MRLRTLVLDPSDGNALRIAFLAFRHRHYCEGRKQKEREQLDGLERDEHDPFSTFLVMIDEDAGGRVVAGTRFIPSVRPLPIVQECGIAVRNPTVEVSRTIVDPHYRHSTILFYRRICEYLEEQEIQEAYAVVEDIYRHVLQKLFSERAFVALGKPAWITTPAGAKLFHVPLRICVDEWKECWKTQRPLAQPESLAA